MDVDAILHEINGWGRYQKVIYFLVCVPTIVAGAAVVSLAWTAYRMAHRCLVPSCEDAANATYNAPFLNFTSPREPDAAQLALPWSQCHVFVFHSTMPDNCSNGAFDASHQVDCRDYVYDKSVMHSSIVSEFELICGRDWMPALANSLYMVGMLIGSLMLGHISDRFGRKVAMLLSFFILGVAGTSIAFSNNFAVFAFLRFLTGIGGMGTFMTTFLLSVETVSNELRTFCGFAIHFFFPFGEAIVGVFAMFVKEWRDLQLLISVPAFIFLSYWFFVPESPRWLAAEGKHAEAEKVLRTAAKFNGTEFPDHLLRKLSTMAAGEPAPVCEFQPPSMSVVDLFRSPALRWRTLIILYHWFVCAMVYYGLGLNATNLGSSVYVNFILVQIIEVPSVIWCMLVLDPWGRKLTLCLSFFLCGFGSIASGLASADKGLEAVTVSFAMLGKFGASATFNIAFVYGAELFPTDIRNSGIGLSSAAGRVGSILAPVITSLGTKNQVLPMSIFGVLALVAGAIGLLLPETYGQKLPDTIEESESFGRDQTFCFVPCLVRRREQKSAS